MVTNNEQNKLNVPHLRFPEFEEEWNIKTLGSLSKGIGDGIHATPIYDDNGSYYFINGNNLSERGINISEATKRVSKEEAYKNNAAILNDRTILLSINGTIGNVALYNNEPIMLGKSACFINVSPHINKHYVYHYLQTNKCQTYFKSELTGTTIKNLSLQSVRNAKIALPSIYEQNRIAKLLDVIDERIATQSKLIEKLESLIKGIMVELQKQGVNKGTWKKVFLSDVLTERNERNTNLFQVFSVSVSQGVVNQVDYLGRSFAAKDTSKYNVVHYGDLVYTKSPTGSFPYGIVKQSLSLENVAVSPLYGVYKPQSLAVGAYLHEYFMSEINTHNYLHPLIQKGAKNTINITNQRFLENCVLLPTNINELLLISKMLRSLNDKFKYQQDTLQKYQKQKKYLLRQMFI